MDVDVGRPQQAALGDDDLGVTDPGDTTHRRQGRLQHRDAAGPAGDVDDDRPLRSGTGGIGAGDGVAGQFDGAFHERRDHRLELAAGQQQRVPGAGQFDDGLRGVGEGFLGGTDMVGEGDGGGRGAKAGWEFGVEFGGFLEHPPRHAGIEVAAAEVVVAAGSGDGETVGPGADEDGDIAGPGTEVEDTHPLVARDVVPAVDVIPSGGQGFRGYAQPVGGDARALGGASEHTLAAFAPLVGVGQDDRVERGKSAVAQRGPVHVPQDRADEVLDRPEPVAEFDLALVDP